MKKNRNARMFLFCEPCSFKMIIEPNDAPDGLQEIKTSPIPGGAPQLDPKTGHAKSKPVSQQMKKYKCPKCGRGVTTKELPMAYTSVLSKLDAQREKEQQEIDRKKRLEDGKPEEKKTQPDFLG